MSKNLLTKTNDSLQSFFAKITIRELFIILLLLFVAIIMSIFTISTYKTIYKTVYQERIEKLRYVGDFATEILSYQDSLVRKHVKTLKEAQNEAIIIMKGVRFENNDYIWINSYDGTMIYHPYPSLIGTDARKLTDHNGYNFGQQLVLIPINKGSGYVQYEWTKLLEPKNKFFSKVSFVTGFKPWEWTIGTGVYIDDIKTKVLTTMVAGIWPVLLVLFLIIIIYRYIMLLAVVVPIETLASISLRLADNDLTVIVPKSDNDTELGHLYNSFGKFTEFFKEKRNNEQKLSLIHNNITDAIITVDNKGIIKSINPMVEKIFGYNTDEIINKSINLLISPVLFDDDNSTYKKKSTCGKFELLGIKKTEEFFDVEVNISEINYEDVNMFILLVRDITEQKEVARMKNEFVSTVSHELRTPLTSIKGSLGLILSGVYSGIPEKVKTLIELANNNCTRLIALINDILDIEKIEAGKMEFIFEIANVAELISQAILMNQPYSEKFNINYKFINNLPVNTCLNIDKNRFNQILTNLLSNACKFSSKNSEVVISATLTKNSVQVSIKDHGNGIPEEFQDKIFNKFTQVDSSDTRQIGGTGLGLSICKNLVEKMNGSISFKTEVNIGTTFTIKFPKV